ncbi:hypothetical protein EON83_12075 [bacterium]|nr:MAG: hypothetical protein EON83_12075 [bacterium]
MKNFKLAATLVALALPVLLSTSAFADDKMGGKMSGHKMSGAKMMGGKSVSVSTLVPMTGKILPKSQMMGAKIVSSMKMNGKPCYTVRLKSGKTLQMCTPADKKAMGHMDGKMMGDHKMSGGKMMGGKMSGDHKMGGKMSGKM